jgi:hypothetical protein
MHINYSLNDSILLSNVLAFPSHPGMFAWLFHWCFKIWLSIKIILPRVMCSGVPRRVCLNPPPKFRSFAKAEPNSQFRGITSATTLSEYEFHSFANWVEPLTRGLLPPDPHFLCPQSSNWICWTPSQKKIPRVNPPTLKKFLGTPLMLCSSVGSSVGTVLYKYAASVFKFLYIIGTYRSA